MTARLTVKFWFKVHEHAHQNCKKKTGFSVGVVSAFLQFCICEKFKAVNIIDNCGSMLTALEERFSLRIMGMGNDWAMTGVFHITLFICYFR